MPRRASARDAKHALARRLVGRFTRPEEAAGAAEHSIACSSSTPLPDDIEGARRSPPGDDGFVSICLRSIAERRRSHALGREEDGRQGAVKLDGQTARADDSISTRDTWTGRCCKSASASSGACGVRLAGVSSRRALPAALRLDGGRGPSGDRLYSALRPVPCALTEAFNGYLWSAILASPVCVSLRPHAVAQVLGGVPSMGARDGLENSTACAPRIALAIRSVRPGSIPSYPSRARGSEKETLMYRGTSCIGAAHGHDSST